MKNKFFKLLLLFLFIKSNYLYADGFDFDVKNIIIEDNGNLIYANFGTAISSDNNFKIVAEKFKYNKDKDFLEKVKFLTINLVKGDVLYIPFKWLYTIRLKKDNTLLCRSTYKVIMNTLAIIPEISYKFLHDQNIKMNFLNTIK